MAATANLKDYPDPASSFAINGKPIYDTAKESLYSAKERQLTDYEQLQWKTFQLHKTIQKMERREGVCEAIIKSDVNSFRATHRIMGTPFPIIESQPSIKDSWGALRWYEHALSFASGVGYYYWLRSRPATAGRNVVPQFRAWCAISQFMMLQTCFTYRSMARLVGNSPNEPEVMKYGTIETPERLKEKAEKWAKFAAYKKEWMKRWNYTVWGMRPGEEGTLFTSCLAPYMPVRYNTRVDYPKRKHPYQVSATELKDISVLPNNMHRPRDYIIENQERTEMGEKALWSGPSQAAHTQQGQRYKGGAG